MIHLSIQKIIQQHRFFCCNLVSFCCFLLFFFCDSEVYLKNFWFFLFSFLLSFVHKPYSQGMSLQEFRQGEDQPLIDKELEYTRESHRVSTFRTFINITKCFVGAASFELPFAVMQAGWLVALLSILVLAVISRYTLVQLAQCGHLASKLIQSRSLEKPNSAPTYPQVGYVAFGLFGSLISYFGIFAMSLGVVGGGERKE